MKKYLSEKISKGFYTLFYTYCGRKSSDKLTWKNVLIAIENLKILEKYL